MKNGRHIAEFFGVGAVLTFVGGYMDAYTYINRGKVFANTQTGNIVLLGVRLTDGDLAGVGHYLIPILSFVLGVLIIERIKASFNDHPTIHWHQLTLILEMIIMISVGFIPHSLDNLANIMVSLISAMQYEGFRRVNGDAYATTMCTGNLRSGTELLFKFFSTGEKDLLGRSMQYYGIILIFIAGAAAGTVLTKIMGTRSILLTIIGLLAAFMILRFGDKKSEKS